MGTRGNVRDRLPAGDGGDGLRRQHKYPRQIFVPAAGKQHLFRLSLQGGHGDLGEAPGPGRSDGGVDPVEIHVRRHEEGHALEHGVPLGHVLRGRTVLVFQRRLGQPCPVVRHSHDLELHRPGGVTGQQVDGKLETAVRAAVGEQLGVILVRGTLQLGQHALVAVPGKEEGPAHIPEPGGLIGEGRQLIHQRHLADAGAYVVHGVQAVPQAGDGGHPGAAPGVGPLPPGDGREEQGGGAVQFLRPEGEGYVLDTTPKSIKIKAGEVQTLRFYNQKQGGIVIKKLDSVTKKPLSGVQFLLTYADGSYVDADNGHLSSKGLYTTDANGEIRLTGIVGTLVISEVKPLDGYVVDPATQNQTVQVNASDTQYITVYNTPIGGVELIKVDAADKTKRLGGVTFEIRKMDGGLVQTVTTSSDGRVHVKLDAGDYYALETGAKSGYKLDPTPHYFTVKDGKSTSVTITNEAFSGIILHKIDSVTKQGIYGVKFLVYDSNRNPVGEFVTDDAGYLYIDDLTVQGKAFLQRRVVLNCPKK